MPQRLNLLTRLPIGQIARFGVIGIGATLVHAAVLLLAVEGGHLAPPIANGLAFACAVFVTYAGQSLWVFRVEQHSVRALRRFIASALFGLGANVAIMSLIVDLLGLDYRIGLAVSVMVVPAITFVINRVWVFPPSDSALASGGE